MISPAQWMLCLTMIARQHTATAAICPAIQNFISTTFTHKIFAPATTPADEKKTPSNHTLSAAIIRRRKQKHISEWGGADWMIKNLCFGDLQIAKRLLAWWNRSHFEFEWAAVSSSSGNVYVCGYGILFFCRDSRRDCKIEIIKIGPRRWSISR